MMDQKSALEIVEKGLRGNTIDSLLTDWIFTIDEVSSNVYKVDGTDDHGHKVSRRGIDPVKVLAECVKDAERASQRVRFFSDIKAKIARVLGLQE